MTESIKYYEGDDEHKIVFLLKNASDLSSYKDIAPESHSSWPIKYHLSASRGNLVRPFCFSGLKVLELGAGMGAISRVIAESAQHLTIIEGTSLRYEGACARLRDLTNWDGMVCNIHDFKTEEKYDAVCMVGVFEYSELYIDENNPFIWVLRYIKNFLKKDGVLILAIENKNGLKYFSGATEDHTGRYYDSICGYSAKKSIRTFSYFEMKNMLNTSGFSYIVPFFPFPDYKLPNAVLHGDLLTHHPRLASQIMANYPSEDCNGQHRKLFSEALAWESIAASGLLEEFANSFLFVASGDAESSILTNLIRNRNENSLAYSYAIHRINPVQTIFIKNNGVLFTEKRSMGSPEKNKILLSRSPVYDGDLYMLYIERKMCFEGKDSVFNELFSFISYIFIKFSSDDKDKLRTEAIDALPHNAIKNNNNFHFFDLEFNSPFPLEKSWFIFRVIFILEMNFSTFSKYDNTFDCKKYYEELCMKCFIQPNYKEDIQRENKFQNIVSGNSGYVIIEEQKYSLNKIKRKIKSKLRKIIQRFI